MDLRGSIFLPNIHVALSSQIKRRSFGYGESEFEASFGLGPRNGDL